MQNASPMIDELRFLENGKKEYPPNSIPIDGPLHVQIASEIDYGYINMTATLKSGDTAVYETGYTVYRESGDDLESWEMSHLNAYTEGMRRSLERRGEFSDIITCIHSVLYTMQEHEPPVMAWINDCEIEEANTGEYRL